MDGSNINGTHPASLFPPLLEILNAHRKLKAEVERNFVLVERRIAASVFEPLHPLV
jgi:hypothetical protein